MADAPPDPEADAFPVQAVSTGREARPGILKYNDSFAVLDDRGDAVAASGVADGVYFRDTRHLSVYALRFAAGAATTLGVGAPIGRPMLRVNLVSAARPWATIGDGAGHVLHIRRELTLEPAGLVDDLTFHNYSDVPLTTEVEIRFAADFADIFEVRGHPPRQRGTLLEPMIEPAAAELGYRARDGVVAHTRLEFRPQPVAVDGARARFAVTVAAKGQAQLCIRAQFRSGLDDVAAPAPPGKPPAEIGAEDRAFNDWLRRSRADLDMLTTATPQGRYPYAGTPWFSTGFGRDGLITALQCLWLDPGLAVGVLRYLAAHQATSLDPAADAEPGKIMHETRSGELARLGEVPFRHYYGSVDSTPLFVLLAAAYFERTGDARLLGQLWPNIEAALGWIDTHGDIDGDGFVEYARKADLGLHNQGWKDSHDSIFHADGSLAEPPIALVEVQGYVEAAKRRLAPVARALGHGATAERLTVEAAELAERIERQFWVEELGCYALALDGAKQPCAVLASNAGHLLFTGSIRADRARRVADLLLGPRFHTGYGIRTIAAGEARYDPLSYHNGSIWPHDNGLIALGLGRYGFKAEAMRVTHGLFEATRHSEFRRLPELFCGLAREPETGPVAYPVACVPQAWASCTAYALLEACLGVEFDGPNRLVRFNRPVLPDDVGGLGIRDLALGNGRLDLRILREPESDAAHIRVLKRTAGLTVVIVPD